MKKPPPKKSVVMSYSAVVRSANDIPLLLSNKRTPPHLRQPGARLGLCSTQIFRFLLNRGVGLLAGTLFLPSGVVWGVPACICHISDFDR